MKKSYKDGTHNFSAHFTFYEYFATVIFPSLDISFQNHLRVHYRNHGFLHLNTFISQEQRILLPYDNSGVTFRKLIIGLGMMFQGSVFSGLSPQFHSLPNWINTTTLHTRMSARAVGRVLMRRNRKIMVCLTSKAQLR